VRFDKANMGDTPADVAERDRSARQSVAERSLAEDPAVQSFVRDFDARIVPESVRPIASKPV
jgi:DNA polymerase III subunit gamma/tau